MANSIEPNMGLVIPGIGTEYSPTWATDINGDLTAIGSHNHSSGQGVQITPSGLSINSDLPFLNNNAIALRSVRFNPQSVVLSLPTDVGCLYVVNNELYYNDVTGGNNVQLTLNGMVNATSSGISSGTASAAFAASVLVVKSSSTSGANVLMQSAVLTNSDNLTNQLTLQAPTLTGSITETLPAIPGVTGIMRMDASGNMSATLLPDNSTIIISGSTLEIPTGGIGTAQLADASVTKVKLSAANIVSQNIASTPCGGTPVLVATLSITTIGRPVYISIVDDGLNSGSSFISQNTGNSTSIVTLLNVAVPVASTDLINGGSSACSWPSGSVQFIDIPAAGTQTYNLYGSSNGTLIFTNLRLVALEQ